MDEQVQRKIAEIEQSIKKPLSGFLGEQLDREILLQEIMRRNNMYLPLRIKLTCDGLMDIIDARNNFICNIRNKDDAEFIVRIMNTIGRGEFSKDHELPEVRKV